MTTITSARRVVAIDAPADPRWDAFVRTHPDAGAYHLSAWSEVLRRAYWYTPRYLALEEDGRIEGVLPLMASRGIVTGRRLRSLPVVGSVGPLATSAEGRRALLEAACRMTDQSAQAWTLHSRVGGCERLVPDLQLTSTSQTFVAALPDDAEALRASWKKTQNNLWRSLRKADRCGVRVRESQSMVDLKRFYRLYEENVRRHRSLPRSYRLFALARQHLLPTGVFRLLVAEHDGEIVAGAVLNAFRGNVDLVYNASASARLDVRPNHAVYWHAIRWAIENGYRTYTMGQAPLGSSLARFKEQWGGEPVDRYRYDYRPGRAQTAGAADSLRKAGSRLDVEGDAAETLLSKAWARAPLPLLRAAGDLVYRLF